MRYENDGGKQLMNMLDRLGASESEMHAARASQTRTWDGYRTSAEKQVVKDEKSLLNRDLELAISCLP